MKYIAILLFSFLCACTTVSHEKEDRLFDTPIPPTIHYVGFFSMVYECYEDVPFFMKLLGSLPLACAHYNVPKNTCDIYLVEGSPDWLLNHELEHCKGFGHKGL